MSVGFSKTSSTANPSRISMRYFILRAAYKSVQGVWGKSAATRFQELEACVHLSLRSAWGLPWLLPVI